MFHVYILASHRNGTTYVGHTNDLARRIWEHREGIYGGFTMKYGVKRLVWFEEHGSREEAFRRERRIKEWRRSWKLLLIEERNPTWRDLFEEVCGADVDVEAWLAELDRRDAAPMAGV
ncbi:GIY-YIG nuclease family protein [Phenylobacterium sp.]|uniref:GIY-YIG nuclease family protein n=1 Tax=Phenylobacterium sp. TaxID=1871053 RepID=UPI00301E5E15